jgi:hypothetical protein
MKLDRREFIRTSLAAGNLFSGTLLTSCRGITRTDLPDAHAADRAIVGLSPRHRSILHYASLAPSGHNSQPRQVKVVLRNQWMAPILIAGLRREPSVFGPKCKSLRKPALTGKSSRSAGW